MEARDGLAKLMSKGTTDLWRLKTRMADQLKDYEKRIAAAASEDNQIRETREKAAKEQEETLNLERSRPSKEAIPTVTGCAGCTAPGCPASTRRASGPTPSTPR